MFFVNRRARKSSAQGSSLGWFHPRCEGLEAKILMSIDLGGTLPSILPNIASAPYGIDVAAPGLANPGGAGFSVADVGNLVASSPYDDFVIGAPTVGTTPGSLGNGIGSAAYLVFGSQTLTATAGVSAVSDWIGKNATTGAFNYTPNDRIADLGQLTSTTTTPQVNPITSDNLDFPFPMIKFVDLVNTQSMLGASVAGVRLASGAGAILIGAPGALNASNASPGTGRVYLISGAFQNFIGSTINLSDPNFASDFPGLNLVTFVNSASNGGQLGRSVAGVSNLFGDGLPDIVLGAPAATVATNTPTPVPTNTGVVYALSTALLSGGSQTIDVSTIGQSGNNSVILAGVNSGDNTGFSVADGGDVNGVTSGGKNVDDLLIGAPDASSSLGAAYLVYGGSSLAGLATTTNNVRYILLSRVGTTGTAAVPGAIITGPAGGSSTGFAVSSAGDFNNDGFGDILIGTPDFSGSSTLIDQGEVTLLYGAASTSSAFLTGTIALGNLPTAIPSATLTGGSAGDLAGYALSEVGFVNSGQPNPILVGAPGFNSSAGTAYEIPGRAGMTGTFSLATAGASPLSALQFVLTTPSSPATSPNFFGASVSSRFQDTTFTADGDSIADFIVGSPGYDITQDAARNLAGGAQIVQGGLVNLPIPVVNTVTTQIGVGTAFGPFNINATTPANLPIYVFGSTTTTPNFMPVTDINPATVTVNGVAFPGATIALDPNTGDYLNNIPTAIITINPRSALRLPTGVDTITISGQMLSTSPLSGFTWTGTATVTVTGGTSGPVVVGLAGVPRGPNLETAFIAPFGANQYTPSLTALSALNYQPLPTSVALAQYLPPQGFRQRIYAFNHPGKTTGPYLVSRGQNKGRASGINTLSSTVFDRSRFHAQKTYTWTHKASKVGLLRGVIPIQTKTQSFDDNLVQSVRTK